MRDGAAFWKVVCGSGGVTAVRTLCALVSNKVLALALGPALFASVAQFQNLLAIGQSASVLGLQNGWVSLTAARRGDPEALRGLWKTGMRLTALASAAAALAFVLAALLAPLEAMFPGIPGSSSRAALLLAAPGLAFSACATVSLSVANGLSRWRLWGAIGIAVPLLQCGWLVAFALTGGAAAVPAALATQSVLAGTAAALLAARCGFSPRAWWRAARGEPRPWLEFAGMSLVPALLGPAVLMAVRVAAGEAAGWEAAGMLQGCWRISDFFSLAVSSALGVWILPRVSADVPRERLPEIVLPVLGRTVALAAAGALAVWALRGLVVPLLFSESFGAMEELLPLQLAGDAIRSAGWCLGLVLMARRRTKLFISAEIVSQLLYACASLALLPLLGIRGPLVAYLAENALYAAALFVLLRRVR